MALEKTIDMSMDACHLFSQKLRKEHSQECEISVLLDVIEKNFDPYFFNGIATCFLRLGFQIFPQTQNINVCFFVVQFKKCYCELYVLLLLAVIIYR